MTSPEHINHQNKLQQLADHLQAASNLLREIASEHVLPLDDAQCWYPNGYWQALENEADAADTNGEFVEFSSMDEALGLLHRQV